MLRDEVLARVKGPGGEAPVGGGDEPCPGGEPGRRVWKAMESLRDEGYVILLRPPPGLRPGGSPDRLSAGELAGALAGRRVGRALVCLETVDSTNNEVKRRALAGAADGLAVVAEQQTGGRAAGAAPLSPLRGRGFICRFSSAPGALWRRCRP